MSRDLQRHIDQQVLATARVDPGWRWWAPRFAPRPLGVAFLCAGLCAMLPWMAFAAHQPHRTRIDVELVLASTYFCALPTLAIGVVLALLFAGSNGGRATVSLATGCIVGGIGVAGVLLGAVAGRRDEWASAALLGAMALVVPLLAAGLFGLAAWTQGKIALLDARAAQLLRLLGHFGSLEETAVVEALGVAPSDLPDIGRRAHALSPIERAHGRLWTVARLRAHQALLLARLEGGERSLAALVEQVGEPAEVLRAWLEGFARDGLHGVVVEGDTVVVKGEAEQAPCDGCGGSMRLVGRALWRCLHCGNERASVTRSAG